MIRNDQEPNQNQHKLKLFISPKSSVPSKKKKFGRIFVLVETKHPLHHPVHHLNNETKKKSTRKSPVIMIVMCSQCFLTMKICHLVGHVEMDAVFFAVLWKKKDKGVRMKTCRS